MIPIMLVKLILLLFSFAKKEKAYHFAVVILSQRGDKSFLYTNSPRRICARILP
jgi:hypothetical protein